MPTGPWHKHLVRQLKKLQLDTSAPPRSDEWIALLERISTSYEEMDRERYTLERSISLVESEMSALHDKLEAEHDRMRVIVEAAPVGIMRVELDTSVSMVNPAFEGMLGYALEDLKTVPFSDLVHPEDRATAGDQLRSLFNGAGTRTYRAQRRLLNKGGSVVYTNLAVSLVTDAQHRAAFAIVLIEDVSDRIRLEMELRQAQKLESVGRLAAGIAHELNTPIQFIGDRVAFLKSAFSDLLALNATYHAMLERVGERLSSEERDALIEAEQAADLEYLKERTVPAFGSAMDGVKRVATIVKAMKSFGHPDRGDKNSADINAALQSTLIVAANELKYVARVETNFGDIPPVPCYISELNQVFLNLLVNGAQAIADKVGPAGGQGTLRVTTYAERPWIVVRIADTGGGIPEAIRHRIFDPFFTTKEVGRGTGQGLAISRSVVVEKHGGSLTFESVLGVGTTFYVRLPIDPGPEAVAQRYPI